jgi:hypothetical protein
MSWFEYHAEVDRLHASDELKARLLAMQPESGETAPHRHAQPKTEPPAAAEPETRAKPPVHFSPRWKQWAAMAACFVLGMGVYSVMSFTGSFFRMGSSSASATALYSSAATADAAPADTAGAWTSGSYAVSEEAAELDSGVVVSESTADAAARSADSTTTERKIIYTAYLYLESKTYDDTRATLEQAVRDVGGYVQASDEYNYTSGSRSVTLTVRIPAAQYSEFLAGAEGAGSLRSKSEQAEDVTAQYIDVAARITSLEAQRTRLTELEAQAESLSDLLEIQDSLTSVQYQLESWQQQMNWYNDQVDYCTVTIELDEVQEYTPVRTSFGERLSGALSDGLTAFADGVQNVAVALAYNWPLVLVLAAVCVGVWLWRRRKSHKKQGKK